MSFHLEVLFLRLTNPGTTPITILAVNSDHGLSFAVEETRTMFSTDLQYFLNSGGSNSPWSEFWSENPHFMGMGVVPAPSKGSSTWKAPSRLGILAACYRTEEAQMLQKCRGECWEECREKGTAGRFLGEAVHVWLLCQNCLPALPPAVHLFQQCTSSRHSSQHSPRHFWGFGLPQSCSRRPGFQVWTGKALSRQHRALENTILRCKGLRCSGSGLPHKVGMGFPMQWKLCCSSWRTKVHNLHMALASEKRTKGY